MRLASWPHFAYKCTSSSAKADDGWLFQGEPLKKKRKFPPFTLCLTPLTQPATMLDCQYQHTEIAEFLLFNLKKLVSTRNPRWFAITSITWSSIPGGHTVTFIVLYLYLYNGLNVLIVGIHSLLWRGLGLLRVESLVLGFAYRKRVNGSFKDP